MGVIFVEYMGGARLFSCALCNTYLTNRGELISTRFNGSTGPAYLFGKVVNLKYSLVEERLMLTGKHMVKDVSCKNCDMMLGWAYDYAADDSQRYKEGKVILEKKYITESN